MTDDDSEEPGPLSDFEAMVFRGPPPAPAHVAQFAAMLAGRAKLKFKDFRVDREEIEGAAVAAMNEGEISKADAQLIFLDTGDIVSTPLAQRYIEMREFELMAKYLRTRLHYHGETRMTPRNRLIFDGMIAGGEAAMAVALVRTYMKKVFDHTQSCWRAAGRKPSKDMAPEHLAQFERARDKDRLELPANLQIAELELLEIEPYLEAHGSREDNRAMEKFREEIARVRKRFGLEN